MSYEISSLLLFCAVYSFSFLVSTSPNALLIHLASSFAIFMLSSRFVGYRCRLSLDASFFCDVSRYSSLIVCCLRFGFCVFSLCGLWPFFLDFRRLRRFRFFAWEPLLAVATVSPSFIATLSSQVSRSCSTPFFWLKWCLFFALICRWLS